ncbi:murein hydrolase activator EnvC family protein [Halocola ammonii]
MKTAAVAVILLLCAFAGSAQTKEELQKQREELNKKIEYTKSLIDKTKQTKAATNEQLVILNKQINFRQQLIANIQNEIENTEGEISSKEEEINELEEEIEALKEEYGQMIYHAYKNRNAYDRLMYIFASESFNQAYKRMKVFQQYARVRKMQAEAIENSQQILAETVDQLEENIESKRQLLGSKEDEFEELASDRKKQQSMLGELQQKEKSLLNQQQQQEREREKLNAAIRKKIEEELAAEREKNNGAYSLTPEGKIISENFEKNKGKLPWPVTHGVIVSSFGKHPHPVIPGIEIENKGVDIATDKQSTVYSIFGGTVTSVFTLPGAGYNVIITHGNYKTVYTNLREVKVKKGDKVDLRTAIGTLMGSDEKNTAHLEIWKTNSQGGDPQNPEHWLMKN